MQKLLPTIFVGNRELFAGVATAGAEYAAAVGRGHASAEAMLVHTLATGGLKCSLHDISFLYFSRKDCKGSNSKRNCKIIFRCE
jgi:hypothetical protein